MVRDVSVEIIKKCPNKCIYCSTGSDIDSTVLLTYEKVKDIVDDLEKMGIEHICLSGGEPFLHSNIIDIVKYIREKNIRVDIYSSGVVYDEKQQISSLEKDLLKQLHNFGLKRIMFNMQALDEDVYDNIMNTKGNYKFLLQSIKNTQEAGIETEIHFVPMKINYEQINKMIQFVEKEKIDQISFLRLIAHGRAKENVKELLLSEQENNDLKKKLIYLQNQHPFIRVGIPLGLNDSSKCNAGKTKLYIKFDGSVLGCEAFKYIDLFHQKIKIIPDNIHIRRVDEILGKSEYLNQEELFITSHLTDCNYGECIENCPVQNYMKKSGI